MDRTMSQEESYADRRQLFKNIWDTAMNVDEKDKNVINKPKVIKTLRLDEVDRCAAGKKKKQRIKNLRIVCNKLLDFCDRQDADDIFYEQMLINGRQSPNCTKEDHTETKILKNSHCKRKAKKAKSMLTQIHNVTYSIATSPERRDHTGRSKLSRNTSPIKIKRASFVCTSPIPIKKSIKSLKKSINENARKREAHNRMKTLQSTQGTSSSIS